MSPSGRSKKAGPKALKRTTTGRRIVDDLSVLADPTIEDYVRAVSDYVVHATDMTAGQTKQAQIALSGALARALGQELQTRVPRIQPHVGELTVAGALRNARADVSEAHPLDGLRLAVELKPVNLAVGRAIWNRFGDVRAFAVNIHLKFPFAVVGGVLAIPTWEWAKVTKAMQRERDAAGPEGQIEDLDEASGSVSGAVGSPPVDQEDVIEDQEDPYQEVRDEEEVKNLGSAGVNLYKRSTLDLINRLIKRLTRTRWRETEADAAHLLEAIAVIVYDPDTATMVPDLPVPGSRLRWNEFVDTLADQYDVRFED